MRRTGSLGWPLSGAGRHGVTATSAHGDAAAASPAAGSPAATTAAPDPGGAEENDDHRGPGLQPGSSGRVRAALAAAVSRESRPDDGSRASRQQRPRPAAGSHQRALQAAQSWPGPS